MATWADIDAELALWRRAGEVATFWWRDDDTEAPTDDLDRLIGLAKAAGAPLHLAVVPHAIDPGLRPRLEAAPDVYALQHGFAHLNHEPKGLRASEVGVSRDPALTTADLREGWRRLIAAKLPRLLPVLVPPWNRIGDHVKATLPRLGYAAFSTFYARGAREAHPGLVEINAHIDPIRWKQGARFAGTEKILQQCLDHLVARRTGGVDKTEPTGFCTHHLQTSEETWDFCAAFTQRLSHKGAVRWVALPEVIHG